MLRRRKAQQKIEDLNGDHFTYRKSVVHGFPASPSAIAFEPELGFLVLGTSKGELKVCGQPGVEYVGELEPRACITHIFTFGKLHQFLTVATDNSIALWALKDEEEDGRFSLSCQKRYALSTDAGKAITSCCVSRTSGYVHLGTEGGNVYSLDIKSFDLTNSVIFWNNATALSQPAAQTHPGAVKSLQPCPADPNKLLIGYELGLISLWDLENGIPTRNYPGTMTEQLTPVEALAWHPSGKKFISSHSNGTITSWTEGHNNKDERLPVNRYGDECGAITKLAWLDSEAEPMVIFSGGLPTEEEGEHHAVSIHHGANAVALDLTSPIVDFVAVSDPHSNKGESLIVLAEQELVAFDLTSPKVLTVRQPYLHPIHASHITSMKVVQNCSVDLFEKLMGVADGQNKDKYSTMGWPAMGGFVKEVTPKSYDILISGHENGSVKFWNITTMGQDFMFEVQTSDCFKLEDQEVPREEGSQEFKWPPYRKVGRYDPLGDDARLAITQLEFCLSSRNLVVGGAGGQVILFTLANTTNQVRVESIQAVVIPKGDRRNTWKGEESMMCVNRALRYAAGFQPRFVLQLYPPAPISALDFKANWGVIAVGTAHGFAVANYLLNNIVLTHCTLAEDGTASHHITRMQSIRRSLRNSIRRRSTRSDRHRSTLERQPQQESGRQSGSKKKQTGSEPPPGAQGGTLPYVNLQAAITHMKLSETYLAGPDPIPALVASTMGSVLIRYHLRLPATGDRTSEPSIAMLAGKDYALLHGAPVVSLFILDHVGLPIPSVYEQDNQIAPAPEMASPHFAVIVTEEQIKVIHLPSLKAKYKEKVSEEIHQRIRKAFLIRVKVLAPAGSPRDWHPALIAFTTYGTALVYSLPALKLCCIVKNFVDPNDIRAQRSITVSSNGEVFYMSSYSEIQRCIFCAYNSSYHISQKPSLHEFPGSTKPLPPRAKSESPSDLPTGEETEVEIPLAEGTVTVVEVHKTPEVEPVEAKAKPTEEQLLKEAEEYLKSTGPPTSTAGAVEVDVMQSAIEFTRSRADSTSSSSSSSSSSSDEEDVGDGDEVVMGNPLAFEDSEQSGRQLDNIIETSLQELNNARKFYQEMQAKAKKTGD